MIFPHADGDYAISSMYSLPDDAWYVELTLAAEELHLATAIVPDEDPAREPTVCFYTCEPHRDLPYEVVRWFMDQVDEEIRTSRAWMLLRPELVEVVHRLRQEHMGVLHDDDFPEVLAEVRAGVPEADLPAVLASAFGRKPDGGFVDHPHMPWPADGQGETA
ncbi:hypothetical protein [Streptomyces sp. NPDC091371]|uniref:hypothetical protein n=1 Tax=Streptomyces sp. NPDC091371 TaxID=3155303 RepID=UPI0034193144